MNKFSKFHKSWKKLKNLHQIKAKNNTNTESSSVYVLLTKESGYITINELNTIKLILKQNFEKSLYKINIKANFYLTKKPIETRMGKGKGGLAQQVTWSKKGTVLIYFYNIEFIKFNIIKKIQKKFKLATKLYNNNQWRKH